MTVFEYKVVPAPTRGLKAKGVKGTPARFANALEAVMNELGAEGWEYQRTDTLPVEERQGLTGKTSSFQNMLVFRRTVIEEALQGEVAGLIEDQTAAPVVAAVAAPAVEPEAAAPTPEAEAAAPSPVQDAPAVEDDSDTEAALSPQAQERVAKTLKSEGFAFPWNSRRKPAAEPTAQRAEADEIS